MISLESLRSNPALLKLDLYCKGIRMDDSCFIEEDGGRKICAPAPGSAAGSRRSCRASCGPTFRCLEPFAQRSTFTLHREKGKYMVRLDGADVTAVKLSPRPHWYDEATATGWDSAHHQHLCDRSTHH